jgi:hypothetical protein
VVLWAGAIYRAADVDGVLTLDGDGRGLLEHYGYWACFLCGPLVLLNSYYAIAYFLRLSRNIDGVLINNIQRQDVVNIIRPYVNSILMRDDWKYMLALFCVIGTALSTVSFHHLDSPIEYWGNDVFNAERYPWSWWVANAYLFILWGFIYPFGLFTVCHIAISVHMIVTKLRNAGALRLDLLHADRCGGMSRFGTLNVLLMLIYGWMAVATVILMVTHKNTYPSAILPSIGLSILFFVHSFVGISSVAKVIQAQRDEAVGSLNERIRKMIVVNRRSFEAAAVTMQYRDRVMEIAAFPYSRGISVAVNFLRFGPLIASAAKVAFPTPLFP